MIPRRRFALLRDELQRLAVPLRDPEPLREIVDEMLRLLAGQPERLKHVELWRGYEENDDA